MADSDFVTVEMVLCTDEAIDTRYGRIRIAPEALHQAAADMNARPDDMTAHHDPNQRIKIRNSHAYVERDEKGRTLLRMRAEVEADRFMELQEDIAARGAPGGMSTTFTSPFIIPDGVEPLAYIVADAADFPDEALALFTEDVPPDLPIQIDRMFQFSADIEPVRVAVVVTSQMLLAVPPNVVATWLAGVISRLRTRAADLGRRPAFDVQIERGTDGEFSLDARFWTDSDAMAVQALEQIVEAVKALGRDARMELDGRDD